jgi:hypothetical protein
MRTKIFGKNHEASEATNLCICCRFFLFRPLRQTPNLEIIWLQASTATQSALNDGLVPSSNTLSCDPRPTRRRPIFQLSYAGALDGKQTRMVAFFACVPFSIAGKLTKSRLCKGMRTRSCLTSDSSSTVTSSYPRSFATARISYSRKQLSQFRWISGIWRRSFSNVGHGLMPKNESSVRKINDCPPEIPSMPSRAQP